MSSVLVSNGYPLSFLQKLTKTRKPSTSSELATKFKSTAVLPYVKGLSDQLRRCLQQQGVRAVFRSETTLRSHLERPKDALPKVLYISSILPSPLEFIKAFQTIIYNFLWKGPDKIARRAVINDFEFGDLKVTDLTTSIMSLRPSWIGRSSSDNVYPWKAYLLHLLKPFGGEFPQYFIRRCYIGGQIFVLGLTL